MIGSPPASSAAGGGAVVAAAGAGASSSNNVQVCVRVRPTEEKPHSWRALAAGGDGAGQAHVQQFDEADKPVPKQVYAFGAAAAAAARASGFTLRRASGPQYPLPTRVPPRFARALADHVLGPEASNADVFGRVARDIVRSVVAGYNGCSEGFARTPARAQARPVVSNNAFSSNRLPPQSLPTARRLRARRSPCRATPPTPACCRRRVARAAARTSRNPQLAATGAATAPASHARSRSVPPS
jgi:hypothetical protein